jgi:hypothetical protein
MAALAVSTMICREMMNHGIGVRRGQKKRLMTGMTQEKN